MHITSPKKYESTTIDYGKSTEVDIPSSLFDRKKIFLESDNWLKEEIYPKKRSKKALDWQDANSQ